MNALTPIPGFEGRYSITREGHIYSHNTNKWLSENSKTQYGYKMCGLWDETGRTTYSFHKLVALTFLPNPDNLEEINHKDGNKDNNAVDNLEWCSHSDNMAHARATKSFCSSKPYFTAEQVRAIRSTPKIHGYQAELCRKHNVLPSTIYNVLHNNTYRWVV